ncbi:TetM/TetW/TetO/TetS family tetracycline resistance ribosomal protection protein [Bifidobacterium sp. ESL0745]|uniref:GTP-binding protein n=1 Tax=Bifidobacterium sp. ESL0745 TaxID=2983226 RepID=UPI0023F8FB6B|nr:TetM/TetW/TetO/TetS family tetracycline resistance ribosomal protection protein [Bifidobacterium sp. ESL0745]MDF7664601.1 TetM/TetW/TetO/TetS family tetracycline resistance ribosomal protection protein [Bifidobacterium sp. ESL0745]
MRRAVVGIAAHVDAGKTTLCEALLYRAGEIRRLGRVDHGDAFLDTDAMEKRRGITIFSKQAILDVRGASDAGASDNGKSASSVSGHRADMGKVGKSAGNYGMNGDGGHSQNNIREDGFEFTLLDTPGHVDFSAEMERTLTVLDYAILVVSANDGLQGYTETLWRLLARYRVPTFIFINKMDTAGAHKAGWIEQMRQRFSEGCVDFETDTEPGEQEEVALLDESGAAMDELLEVGRISDDTLRSMVVSRQLFPCYSGSALKLEGVDEFLVGLERFTRQRDYPGAFGARVYKISHDDQGNRLTWLKVTGGSLKVKAMLTNARGEDDSSDSDTQIWQEKVDQIRRYSGSKFDLVDEVAAGDVCAMTGLTKTFPGEGLGFEADAGESILRPVLTYTVLPGVEDSGKVSVMKVENAGKSGKPEPSSGADGFSNAGSDGSSSGSDRRSGSAKSSTVENTANGPQSLRNPVKPAEVTPELHKILVALRTLEDEDPALNVRWVARLGEIHVQLMGAVQVEIITQMLHDRFGIDVHFGTGGILYRETIAAPMEGIGHFEPLRHYAEVHLLLEPGEPGSGLHFESRCSLDDLDRNWQRAILTHLREKEHLGVLTGSPITDMRISLVAGRGHEKHTEGGDFREATYRAVRQGLMELKAKGECRLLEPFYSFRLQVPQDMLGRAMADIQRMSGTFDAPKPDGDYAELEGSAPVSEMRDYSMDVNAYTHGRGSLACVFAGYKTCHNADEVIKQTAYDPETDLENTPDSVFCAHGAGYAVKWNKVPDFAHVDSGLSFDN